MAGPAGTVKRFTLTAPGTDELLDRWKREVHDGSLPEDTWLASAMAYFNDEAPNMWNHFVTLLRQRTGVKWEFWKVAERQVRGVTHYQGSLRASDGRAHFIPMEVFRDCAVRAGFGRIVGLDALRDARAPVAYAGKAIAAASGHVSYHGKTVLSWSWRRQHVVSTSHDWARTWTKRVRRPSVTASGWSYNEREAFIRELGGDPEDFPPAAESDLRGRFEYVDKPPPPRHRGRAA